MKKLLLALLTLLLLSSGADAAHKRGAVRGAPRGAGVGPGPIPQPWGLSGVDLFYNLGGVVLPLTVTGGSKGVGTINVQGLYVNGLPVLVAGGLHCSELPALTGDATTTAGSCTLTVTKTGGVAFAPSATVDTTNAGNIGSGTLNAARLPAVAARTDTSNTFTADQTINDIRVGQGPGANATNTMFGGADAFQSNTTGVNNTVFGWAAGDENTTGSDNTDFGMQAGGGQNGEGSGNTNIGSEAGDNDGDGSNNTNLGFNSGTVITSPVNETIALGANANPTASNQWVINPNITNLNWPSNLILNQHLAQAPATSLKGNSGGSAANVSDLTPAQATSIINPMVGDSGSGGVKGLVPAPPAGSTASQYFLRADGTWNFPTNIPNVNLATVPANTIKGALASGTPQDMTPTQATSILNPVVGDSGSGGTKGLVPAPPAGSTAAGKYLGADGIWRVPPGTAAPVVSGIRQTVQAGPATGNNVPNFLPATSASLTLTTQNISSTSALVVSGPAGPGLSDLVQRFTGNISWTLSANATNYFAINAASGALSDYTLVPIDQCGGTISVTNNQFTFDHCAYVGYLGNGTTAPQTPLVFVGEAVAGTATVTSTKAYAYNGAYESPMVTPLAASQTGISYTHNLGTQNYSVRILVKNITSENGYSVGSTITPNTSPAANAPTPFYFQMARNVANTTTGANQAFAAMGLTAGTMQGLTAANWYYGVIVQRNW